MPAPRKVKGFSKKAAAQINKNRKKATPRLYGKSILTVDPDNPDRAIGYADPGKTKLPKIKIKKASTRQGRKANRRAAKR